MNEPEPAYREAVVKHHRWWAGWIWAVPLAALGIVVWLAVRTFANRGPEVTVTFESAGGVRAGDTKVRYKDMEVGEVVEVQMQHDLRHVDVTLRLYAEMNGHLGPGTRFWIAGETVSLSDPSTLRSLIAGPYIGIDPQPGEQVDHFVGLDQVPVLKAEPAGTSYTLHAGRLGSVSRGSPIYHLDLQVGEVQGYKLVDDGHGMEIYAFVQAPYDRLVHAGTRFWDASAVRVATGAGGPELRLQSLPALLQGAIAFATPSGPAAGPPAKPDDRFELYDNQEAAENAPTAAAVSYLVQFHAPDGSLEPGAPVKLTGARVGTVKAVSLEYDPDTGRLGTRAIVLLEPSRITLVGAGHAWQSDPRAQMDALLQKLIAQGLRAQLVSSPPVIGGPMVALRFVTGAAPAALQPGDIPEIPTAPPASIEEILATASDIATRIDEVPLPEIARDVRTTTQRLADLAQSPELGDSLNHLDRSLTNLDQVTGEARQRLGPLLTQLDKTASEAEATLAAARLLLGQGGGQLRSALPEALYEITRAARSLRELSDYLSRHPEALLRGR